MAKKMRTVQFTLGGQAAPRAAARAVSEAQRAAPEIALNKKTKRDRLKAQKLAIRGLRSKRSAGYFAKSSQDQGSSTIG